MVEPFFAGTTNFHNTVMD